MFESDNNIQYDEIFAEALHPDSCASPKRALDTGSPSTQTNHKKMCLELQTAMGPLRPTTCMNTNNSETRHCSLGYNKSELHAFSTPIKKVVARKFPGPAGLLPEPVHSTADTNRTVHNARASEKRSLAADEEVIYSQMSVRAFSEGPWEQMRRNFSSLPDKYNIAWIKEKAKMNKLINQKAPFLAAIVQSIECPKVKTTVVPILLKDTTGCLHATLIYDLYEKYVDVLKISSVIVLKQFGVLKTEQGGSNYNVIINIKNLVAIYSQSANEQDQTELKVNATILQEYSAEDFYEDIAEIKIRHMKVKSNPKVATTTDQRDDIKFQPPDLKANLIMSNNTYLSTQKVETKPLSVTTPKPKFNFKSCKDKDHSVVVKSQSLSREIFVTTDNSEHRDILQTVFEGVDADLLFEDF